MFTIQMFTNQMFTTQIFTTWNKSQACKHCLRTIFEKIVDFLDKVWFFGSFYPSQLKCAQLKSSQFKSSQLKSSQLKNSQLKSSQLKVHNSKVHKPKFTSQKFTSQCSELNVNCVRNSCLQLKFTTDIEIKFELTLLTYKVFSCKDVRSKFLGVRLLAVQSNTQSRSWNGHPSNH